MQAVRVHEHGGTEALVYEDIPQPQPGPDQVLIKVAAAGVNFIDVYHRTGLYPNPLPLTLGSEATGTVAAVGSNVKDIHEGDLVGTVNAQGAYAEYALVPAGRIIPLPPA